MKIREVVDYVKNTIFVNIPRGSQASEKNVYRFINDSLIHLHSLFDLRYEQAMIMIPKYRRLFKLDNRDPNVVMATINRFGCAMFAADQHIETPDIIKQGYSLSEGEIAGNIPFRFAKKFSKKHPLYDFMLNKISKWEAKNPSLGFSQHPEGYFDLNLQEDIVDTSPTGKLNNKPSNKYVKNRMFEGQQVVPLQLVDAYNEAGEYIGVNNHLVQIISPTQVNIPLAQENEIYFIGYKPSPAAATPSDRELEIDLPSNLMDLMFAHINLRANMSVTNASEQFYPMIQSLYDKALQKALAQNTNTTTNLDNTVGAVKKGFYI